MITPTPATMTTPLAATGQPKLGEPYSIVFSAAEPGNEQMQSWTVDWGDGTTDTLGANASGATHTYQTLGQATIR